MTKLLIIYTGGTIGMVQDQQGQLIPFDFENITHNVPELARLNYTIDVHSFEPILDSSNMTPEVWIELVKIIEKKYNSYDGFVVLHGSDTMAYSASALSFMLENLAKPVVFTGSQLPIGEIRTDAKENLITALEIAATKKNGKAVVPEVCIYFDYQLIRGNRSNKFQADKFEAFQSANYPLLAEAGVQLKFHEENILVSGDLPLKTYTHLDTQIATLKLFPGISKATVDAVFQAPGIKAVVLETFGTGNTCTRQWFIDSLREAIGKGMVVVDISQCSGGAVDLGRYETSKHLVEMGVLSGFDMTFEAAVTKLMFLLAQNLSEKELNEQVQQNLRGELSRS